MQRTGKQSQKAVPKIVLVDGSQNNYDFNKLLTDLHEYILTFLDIPALVRLSATSKYFKAIATKELECRKTDVSAYVLNKYEENAKDLPVDDIFLYKKLIKRAEYNSVIQSLPAEQSQQLLQSFGTIREKMARELYNKSNYFSWQCRLPAAGGVFIIVLIGGILYINGSNDISAKSAFAYIANQCRDFFNPSIEALKEECLYPLGDILFNNFKLFMLFAFLGGSFIKTIDGVIVSLFARNKYNLYLPNLAIPAVQTPVRTKLARRCWKLIDYRDPIMLITGLVCLGILIAQKPFSDQHFDECIMKTSDTDIWNKDYYINSSCYESQFNMLDKQVIALTVPGGVALCFSLLGLLIETPKFLQKAARCISSWCSYFSASDNNSVNEHSALLPSSQAAHQPTGP